MAPTPDGPLSLRKLPKNPLAPSPAINAGELRIIHALVPTLCVGTPVPTLCVEYGPNLRPKLRRRCDFENVTIPREFREGAELARPRR